MLFKRVTISVCAFSLVHGPMLLAHGADPTHPRLAAPASITADLNFIGPLPSAAGAPNAASSRSLTAGAGPQSPTPITAVPGIPVKTKPGTTITLVPGQNLEVSPSSDPSKSRIDAGSQTPAGVHDAFQTPVDLNEARNLIQIAETRKLSQYLGAGGTPISIEEFQKFEADFRQVLEANIFIKFADGSVDRKGFVDWWNVNKAKLLFARGSMGSDVSLQAFFANVYVNYKIDELQARENPTGFVGWLSHVISNPLIRSVTTSGYVVAAGTLTFVTGMAYGAMVAGPVGNFFNQFFGPLLGPLGQKAQMLGQHIWEKPGVALNRWLFAQKNAGAVESIEAASSSIQKAQQFVQDLGYDGSPAQLQKVLGDIKLAWIEANQIWLKTQPPALQNGRSVLSDALIFKPNYFAIAVLQPILAAETFQQGIDDTFDRIRSRSNDPAAVDNIAEDLERVLGEQVKLEHFDARTGYKAEDLGRLVNDYKARLITLGATEKQVARVIEGQRRVFVFTHQAGTALAVHLFHDMQYEELNRSLPEHIRQASQAVRRNFALDFFHAQFRQEVLAILTEMNLKLEVAKQSIEAARDPRTVAAEERLAKAAARQAPTNQKPSNAQALSREVSQDSVLGIVDSVNQDPTNARMQQRVGELSSGGRDRAGSNRRNGIRETAIRAVER